MKISIITATYNSASTLKDTLDSILDQSYKDYELIIKDGGSKDNTLVISKEFEPKFEGRMRIISTRDKGLYDAMNEGINLATGDVIGILNSDDFYYDNNVLKDIAEAFEKEDIDCVYGDLVYVDANDTDKVVRTWKGSQFEEGKFQRGWAPAHPSFYARRVCFEKYGGFDLSFAVSADFELMLRLLGKHKIKSRYLPRKFVKMRVGGESNGSLKNIIRGNKNILRAFKKNGFKVWGPLYTFRRLFPKVIDAIVTRIKK